MKKFIAVLMITLPVLSYAQTFQPVQTNKVEDWYILTLGRNPDFAGLNFWNQRIANGEPVTKVYDDFIASAKANGENVNTNLVAVKDQQFNKYDNTAPYTYVINDVPTLQKTTEDAIHAAINQAIENNRANGYELESGTWLNTLRGYFTGDKDLRDRAIWAAAQMPGVSPTSDYGFNGLRGKVKGDTTPYKFTTSYNPKWDYVERQPDEDKYYQRTSGNSSASTTVSANDLAQGADFACAAVLCLSKPDEPYCAPIIGRVKTMLSKGQAIPTCNMCRVN